MSRRPFLTRAVPQDDFTVRLTFEGGEERLFDARPLLDSEVFAPLNDLEFFRQVRVVYGSLEWPGERALAYDMLHHESVPLDTETASR
jgi:hypothetical protein